MTVIVTSPKPGVTAPAVSADTVDLGNCDREQIQYIEAIQPHGALLIVEEPSLRIVQYSANLSAFLGLAGAVWHGQTLKQLLGEDSVRELQKTLTGSDLERTYLHLLTLSGPNRHDAAFHLFGNRMDGLLIIELERAVPNPDQKNALSLHTLHNALPLLKRPGKLQDFLQRASDLIKTYTGFERVMIYRFEPDGSGHVIAESREPTLEAYLGLHYPASDIPEPSRRLFQHRATRFLPDVDYQPVPLLPTWAEAGLERPVDLSFSTLRSVSLMYSVYLKNMGVKSTLVMPLLINRNVWGLISCMHHSAPRYLAYPDRIPAELLAGVITQWLREYEDGDYARYRERLQHSLIRQAEQAADQTSLHFAAEAIARLDLLNPFDADGVAVIMQQSLILLGCTPTENQVRQIADWLSQHSHTLYHTECLARDYPPAAEFGEICAGLLAIVLPKASENVILWFRKEYPQEINWAGNPDKPVVQSGEGALRELHPRNSFALWKQITRGRSRNWLVCELDYANELRQTLTDIILQRLKLVGDLNPPPETRQQELDSFFYSAAHDLREPLLGMRNYVQLIHREEAGTLSDKNAKRMDTLLQLTYRMEETLKSLMWFSTTGKEALQLETHKPGDLIREVADMVILAYPRLDIRIEIQSDMPTLPCDAAQVKTIYQNLIRNAVKYNDNETRLIEIGYYPGSGTPVFFVRDNGIGIPAEHHATIFQLFSRLHSSDAYGGGTGAGMTIVQKAIQRHGGHIWLDSTPGRGTTFFFTLTPSPPQGTAS